MSDMRHWVGLQWEVLRSPRQVDSLLAAQREVEAGKTSGVSQAEASGLILHSEVDPKTVFS